MIERTIKAKKAKSVFFQKFNDIDIYVEDTSKGSKKLYSILLSRALSDKYRVSTVFPLGNKYTVIDECQKDNDSERLKLYIVDGDLELLLNNNQTESTRLYVLKRYCIENYLIDENAIVELLHEEDLERSLDEIRGLFDYPAWLEGNELALFDLFVLYSLTKKYDLGIASVSHPVNRLVSSSNGMIDNNKIQERMKAVSEEIEKEVDKNIVEKDSQSINDLVRENGYSKLYYVSAKDYLIPLLLMRMREIVKFRAENAVIKQRLAMKCDISELTEISSHLAQELTSA